MTISHAALGAPEALIEARRLAHIGVHLLTKSARANLEPTPDDSHSSMSWSDALGILVSPEMAGGIQTGLSLAPFALHLLRNGKRVAAFPLEGQTLDAAKAWLDVQQTGAGLHPSARTRVPYKMAPEVMAITGFDNLPTDALAHLAGWFALAQSTLSGFAAANAALEPGPSPVRLWPHHFDIATYVALEEGNAEEARGVGVGMSAGDGIYEQPYFYVNPWPHPDAARLPDPVTPGHWHSEGFVGAVATGEEILTLAEIETGTSAFLSEAFAAGRSVLGV